jgi:hypothetical protein
LPLLVRIQEHLDLSFQPHDGHLCHSGVQSSCLLPGEVKVMEMSKNFLGEVLEVYLKGAQSDWCPWIPELALPAWHYDDVLSWETASVQLLATFLDLSSFEPVIRIKKCCYKSCLPSNQLSNIHNEFCHNVLEFQEDTNILEDHAASTFRMPSLI